MDRGCHAQSAGDRVVVQRIDEGEQKVGGIIIPDSAKEKPQQGKVIAAGNGKSKDDGKRVPLDVKPGDSILFGKYSGQDIKLDGDEYLIFEASGAKAQWPNRLCTASSRGRRSSAASTSWPTP
jgi:chaperonin GroES